MHTLREPQKPRPRADSSFPISCCSLADRSKRGQGKFRIAGAGAVVVAPLVPVDRGLDSPGALENAIVRLQLLNYAGDAVVASLRRPIC